MSLMTPAPHRYEDIDIPVTARISGLGAPDQLVQDMICTIKRGDKLPAIEAEQRRCGSYRIINGFHRAAAFRTLGLPIPARVAISEVWNKKGDCR